MKHCLFWHKGLVIEPIIYLFPNPQRFGPSLFRIRKCLANVRITRRSIVSASPGSADVQGQAGGAGFAGPSASAQQKLADFYLTPWPGLLRLFKTRETRTQMELEIMMKQLLKR